MSKAKIRERKIGDEFFSGFYGKNYEVCSSESCEGCDFASPPICVAHKEETGECLPISRIDGKQVIFKEVKWRKK